MQSRVLLLFLPHASSMVDSLTLQFEDDVKAEFVRLTASIQPRLLKFCCPEPWVPVDVLPCTLTGKLNCKCLQEFFHRLPPSTQNELAMLATSQLTRLNVALHSGQTQAQLCESGRYSGESQLRWRMQFCRALVSIGICFP
ncbi:hypothetical protein BKA82DRAFT_2554429 [Pisolithus tinctorius]|nr:hypothetical protein BKA82DRAFT_2554429 [Pisolithus tinctorius]